MPTLGSSNKVARVCRSRQRAAPIQKGTLEHPPFLPGGENPMRAQRSPFQYRGHSPNDESFSVPTSEEKGGERGFLQKGAKKIHVEKIVRKTSVAAGSEVGVERGPTSNQAI